MTELRAAGSGRAAALATRCLCAMVLAAMGVLGALPGTALATSAGELDGFGWNRFGQLGSATNSGTENPNPTPVQVSLPGASGPVVQVAAGNSHSLAVTASGQLYTFGRNFYGQLGSTTNVGTENPNPTPVQVSLPGASGPVVQVANGGNHSLAVTSSGQLYTFGFNLDGQLGSATNSGTVNPNPTPVQVSLPGATGPVVQVAAAGYHSLAVTSTGQLFAFGNNFFGQLGSTTNNGTSNPNPTPTPVSLPGASGAVVQVAAGGNHSLAVTSSGQLYGFGRNFYGQLGSATNSGTENPNPTPVQVGLPSGASADTVAAGANHSLVLIADLSVVTGSLPGGTAGARYSARLQAAGGTAPYRWSASGLPAGLAIDSASGEISGTPPEAGSATVTVRVTDRYGVAAARTLALAIGPAASIATAPPRLSGLGVSPRRLSLAGRLVHGRCKPPSGANRHNPSCRQKLRLRLSFEVDAAATVTVAFSRLSSGRRLGGRCVAPTEVNRKRPRCTRSAAVGGRISQRVDAGPDTVVITRPALAPGRYQLTVTPSSAGQEGSSATTTITVTG